jgi:hypothetical protein
MVKGITAISSAVNTFNEQCPDTKLVLVGYSQGGQITDNAFCGGPDDSNGYTDSSPAISAAAMEAIAAVIEMGSPRFVGGLDYGVGTCTTGGFSARPSGYTCAVSHSLPFSWQGFPHLVNTSDQTSVSPKRTTMQQDQTMLTMNATTVKRQNAVLLRQLRPLLL